MPDRDKFDFDRLRTSLVNSRLQVKDNSLYFVIDNLISGVALFQKLVNSELNAIIEAIELDANGELIINISTFSEFYSADLWAKCLDPSGLAGFLVFSKQPSFEDLITLNGQLDITGNISWGSAVGNVMLKPNGPVLEVRRGNDSLGAGIRGEWIALTGSTNPAQSGIIRLPNQGSLKSRNAADTADIQLFFITAGNNILIGPDISSDIAFQTNNTVRWRIVNTTGHLRAENGTQMIQWGSTNAFPALKRSFAELHVRLADDTDYAIFRARGFRAHSDNSAVWIGQRFSNSAGDGANFESQRARGTQAAPLAVQANDVLNGFFAGGATSPTTYSSNVAVIRALANQNFSAGNCGSFWEFYTTPNGTDVRVLHWILTADGHWQAGQGTELIKWGATSSFPALKRNTTTIEVRLGDDSDYTDLKAKNVEAASYSVGGTPGASGTFTTADAKTVTVVNGLITSIV